MEYPEKHWLLGSAEILPGLAPPDADAHFAQALCPLILCSASAPQAGGSQHLPIHDRISCGFR